MVIGDSNESYTCMCSASKALSLPSRRDSFRSYLFVRGKIEYDPDRFRNRDPKVEAEVCKCNDFTRYYLWTYWSPSAVWYFLCGMVSFCKDCTPSSQTTT